MERSYLPMAASQVSQDASRPYVHLSSIIVSRPAHLRTVLCVGSVMDGNVKNTFGQSNCASPILQPVLYDPSGMFPLCDVYERLAWTAELVTLATTGSRFSSDSIPPTCVPACV